MVAQGFSEDAVELPHLAERRGRPAVRRDARLDLFSERREELGVLREVVEYMGSRLRHIAEQVSRITGAADMRGMESHSRSLKC